MRVRTTEISVGLFMLAGFIALVFLAFRVSGLSSSSLGDTYTIKARFTNAIGLKPRSKVTIAGVTVGQVSKITIDNDTHEAIVEMRIDEKIDNLTADSGFMVLTAGLLGDKYIGITLGGDPEVLKDGDEVDTEYTQSALVLEDLIGKFVTNMGKNKETNE